MKNLIAIFVLMFICMFSFAQVNQSNHYVRGYYKSNGTYVQGHYRTNPNSTKRDNYSSYPNYNPYTGKQGTVKIASNELTNLLNSYGNSNSTIDNLKLPAAVYSIPKNDFVMPKIDYPSYDKNYKSLIRHKWVTPKNTLDF